MVSITHLLSSSADEQTRQVHRMLTRGLGIGFSNTTQPVGSGNDLRSLINAIRSLRQQRPEIVYAWGTPALAVAVIAGCDRIIYSPDRFAGKTALKWIRALMSRRNVTMVCPTFTQKRLAISRGIDPDRCIVIPPGVDFGSVRPHRDPSLRTQLGFSPSDVVLLAVGESDEFSDHKQAVWTAAILNVLDSHQKLLIWGRGRRTASLTNLSRRLKQPQLITSAEQKLNRKIGFESLLGIADICLITTPGAGPTLPVAMAMAAGVPIVSSVTYTLAELLEDRHTALMVPTRSSRALVQRILDLQADPALRDRLIATARSEAYEHFSMTRMLDAYRQLITGTDPIKASAGSMQLAMI